MTLCDGPSPGVPCPHAELVRRGRCERCERERRDAVNRRAGGKAATHVERTERNWRMIRARYLRAHPTCERAGCSDASTDVHHIVDRADGGTSAYSNLEALCKRHHSIHTATHQTRMVRRAR